MPFLSDLRTSTDLDLLVSLTLFDGAPFVFMDDRARAGKWRRDLATELAVDPHAIVMVGSAALGVSLNPYKGFKGFGTHSDIDVAVISPMHFEEAWWFMRTLGSRYFTLPRPARVAVDDHRRNYIYAGTVATDRMLVHLPFGSKWFVAGKRLGTDPDIGGRRVNFRLYRDPMALRLYQRKSFAEARTRLLAIPE